MSLATQLKACRERLAYTQTQVSQAIKIPRETISCWENDKRQLRALAEASTLVRVVGGGICKDSPYPD